MGAQAFESVSSWRQPTPEPASPQRTRMVRDVADVVVERSSGRVRVIVDGRTGSGKTSFAHELAAAVRALGRPTLRASLDDFKKPWREARELGYDRTSAEGYYRNAPDVRSARTLLLEPCAPDGSGIVALCAHDPLTGEDHRATTVAAPHDAVLIVDSVFGMRPEYDDCWEVRIWLDVPPDVAMARGIARDAVREGEEQAERVHRDRYQASERIYLEEVDPRARADLVIDNTDVGRAEVIRPRPLPPEMWGAAPS